MDTAQAIERVGSPVMSMQEARSRFRAVSQFTGEILREGVDYGKIPNAGDKPALFKAGAEKLSAFFGLAKSFSLISSVEDWSGNEHDGEPFFYYFYKCTITVNGALVSECEASANSWETKFRYRRGGEKNPNPANIVNTVQKMAQKRAFVGATLLATNASDSFTQDIEDMPTEVFAAHRQETSSSSSTSAPAVKPRPKTNGNGSDVSLYCPAKKGRDAGKRWSELSDDSLEWWLSNAKSEAIATAALNEKERRAEAA